MKHLHAPQRLLLLSGTIVSLFVVLLGMTVTKQIDLLGLITTEGRTCKSTNPDYSSEVQGVVTFTLPLNGNDSFTGTLKDKCLASDPLKVVKYGCSLRNDPVMRILSCPGGCVDGICKSVTQESGCGTEGKTCCSSPGAAPYCNQGTNLFCIDRVCRQKSQPTCGGDGEACCSSPGAAPSCKQGTNLICVDRVCKQRSQPTCGGKGESCCPNAPQCTPGTNLFCIDNGCRERSQPTCGGLGQSCCGTPPWRCNQTPNPISCIDGVCRPKSQPQCGAEGQTCCANSPQCTPGTNLKCIDRFCKAINTGGCTANIDCNDQNPCTTDQCINRVCRNASIPNCRKPTDDCPQIYSPICGCVPGKQATTYSNSCYMEKAGATAARGGVEDCRLRRICPIE